MQDPVKAYQCRHLFADGHRCGSKSLRGEPFCFYHHTTRKPTPRPAAPESPATTAFDLPFPEDRASIQLAIGDILRRIAANQLDPRRAGLLLYGLQIASCNLPRPKSQPEDPEETVDEVETHPEHGPLAPQAEFVPPEEQPSFLRGLFQEMGLDEEDEQNPSPTHTKNPIPTLQATAQTAKRAPQARQPQRLTWGYSPPSILSPRMLNKSSPPPSPGNTLNKHPDRAGERRPMSPQPAAAAQTLQTLTHHFAIPGTLAFREEHGLLFADISTSAATATLCLQGAHLTHWQPAGQKPVIFLSQKSDMAPGKAIRGGIPLLFPWFGPRHDGHEGPAHGFARTQNWQLDFAALSGEDLHLTLTQTPTDLSRSLGFDHFRLAFQVTLGKDLKLQLTVANEGDQPLLYEEGMHTYFHVADIHEIAIEGLDGTSYIDKKDEFKIKPQVAGPMHITAPTDRVYLDTTTTCTIHDPAFKRTITVAKEHSRNTVVWNPWAEMSDIHPNGWHEFVCVETVNVGDHSITLAPGQTHTMQSHITLS